MSALTGFIIGCIAVETVSLLGFCLLAKTEWAAWGKMLALALFLAGTLLLLTQAVQKLPGKKLIHLILIVTLCMVALFQILGFTLFPGLAKEIELFSPAQFKLAFYQFLSIGLYHAAVAFGVKFLIKIIKKG